MKNLQLFVNLYNVQFASTLQAFETFRLKKLVSSSSDKMLSESMLSILRSINKQ